MANDRNTFAFRLARRAETYGAPAGKLWQARTGPPIAGCTGMPSGDYRTGPFFNPDSGFFC